MAVPAVNIGEGGDHAGLNARCIAESNKSVIAGVNPGVNARLTRVLRGWGRGVGGEEGGGGGRGGGGGGGGGGGVAEERRRGAA